MARRRHTNPAQQELPLFGGPPLAHGSSTSHGGLVQVQLERTGPGVKLTGTPAPVEGAEPWWRRMGYARDPNEAPIVGYAFKCSPVVGCLRCTRERMHEGYHPDLRGLGPSIPLLRTEMKKPPVDEKCLWCGVEVKGSSGYLAWLKGDVR